MLQGEVHWRFAIVISDAKIETTLFQFAQYVHIFIATEEKRLDTDVH